MEDQLVIHDCCGENCTFQDWEIIPINKMSYPKKCGNCSMRDTASRIFKINPAIYENINVPKYIKEHLKTIYNKSLKQPGHSLA